MNPNTNNTVYELHGQFEMKNLDSEHWEEGEVVSNLMGMYQSRELVDWLTINTTYSKDSSKVEWLCDDGYSSID